jgi:hypothetical protein
MTIFSSGGVRRVRVLALAIVMVSTLLGATVVAPSEAQAAASGWCTTASPYLSGEGNWTYYVPTIGVGGTRSCLMSQGSVSAGVGALQATLKYCQGYNPGTIDRNWGPSTNAAVLQAQRDFHLTADGVYGPQTHNSLVVFATVVHESNAAVCIPDFQL